MGYDVATWAARFLLPPMGYDVATWAALSALNSAHGASGQQVTHQLHTYMGVITRGGGGSFQCKLGDFPIFHRFLKNVVPYKGVCYTFSKSPAEVLPQRKCIVQNHSLPVPGHFPSWERLLTQGFWCSIAKAWCASMGQPSAMAVSGAWLSAEFLWKA